MKELRDKAGSIREKEVTDPESKVSCFSNIASYPITHFLAGKTEVMIAFTC